MRTVTDIRWWMAVLALMVVGGAPVTAQGWIEPGVDRGGITVDKVRSEVLVEIEGRVAQIEVSEWFVNNGGRLAEGEYHYPLPGEAVFRGFSLFQGDAELRGEIMDAERAREIYESIVRRRADPALIELAGQGLLRARVFPIQPGETRKVTLRYTQVLERAGEALQLDYVGGVRGSAHPGDRPFGEGRVESEPVEVSFEVRVPESDLYLDPFSPTHTLTVDRREEEMTVRIKGELSGRLSLFLPLAGDAVGMSVATHRPIGEDGYFMLTLSPDREAEAAEPKDVTVVLDVSGSMSGEKIAQARQALHQLLSSLSEDDRFRLLAFSSAVRAQSRDFVHARGRGLDDAREWIDRLAADGGTNIGAALSEAFRLESPGDRLPVVLFLTDGLPSVGEESPDRLAEIASDRAGRARVFAFGVGHDVNTRLLDRLSEAGRGDTDYVQPGENVERVLSLLATKISHPVLTDLGLWGGPERIHEIYPVTIPDVFAGEELVLFGRYTGDGGGQLSVTGHRLGEELEFSTELVFPEATEANDFIPRLWASRKLGHLERQIWTEGETTSLVEEIRTLALRYGLPSRFTAYLVEEPGIVAQNPGRPGLMPGDQPLALQQIVVAANRTSMTGESAVRMAEAARQRRETASAADLRVAEEELEATWADADASLGPTRAIGGRVFRLDTGVWKDVAFIEGRRLIEIRAFGAVYFDIIRTLPELEPVLRELNEVVVAGAEVSLRVGGAGADELSDSELAQLVRDFRGESGG